MFSLWFCSFKKCCKCIILHLLIKWNGEHINFIQSPWDLKLPTIFYFFSWPRWLFHSLLLRWPLSLTTPEEGNGAFMFSSVVQKFLSVNWFWSQTPCMNFNVTFFHPDNLLQLSSSCFFFFRACKIFVSWYIMVFSFAVVRLRYCCHLTSKRSSFSLEQLGMLDPSFGRLWNSSCFHNKHCATYHV